jgi:lantibiotic modifying enzyme
VERRAAGFADGFHLGWAGTAWAAALGGALLANRSLVERSRRIARARALDPVAPGEFDLLNGAAGTMLGLALLAEALSDPSLLDPARRLATALERGADRRGRTASWSISGVSTDANLTGLSHGAAGVAHALLELSRVTGDFGPRRLADEAVRYERTYFDPAEGNWPDLRRRDGDGPARGVRRRFMVAWCHGAAGIGLARLHAAAVLDDSESRAEARQASATVRRDLSTRLEHSVLDLSLCHGALGPAMALCACAAHGLVGEARVEPLITEVAVRVERAAARERAGLHVRRQPGLFLGRAGIVFAAYALAGEPTPPVLLPTAISGLGGRNSP